MPWRILLILTLVFQPTLLSSVAALAAFGDTATACPHASATTCCAFDSAAMNDASCCGGPSFCTCAVPEPDDPIAPPTRNTSVDQVFASLQLPVGTIEPAPKPINDSVNGTTRHLTRSAQAMCAALCVWRT